MSQLIQNAMTLEWGKIMGTLLVRFVGVFLVLIVLMIGMILLGKVVSTLVASRQEHEDKEPAHHLAEPPEHVVGEEEIVAAMGAAIAMALASERTGAAAVATASAAEGSWAMAGRVTEMNRRLQGGDYRHS